jgi:hypothetical protein
MQRVLRRMSPELGYQLTHADVAARTAPDPQLTILGRLRFALHGIAGKTVA